jgi:electron transport complex protein RnfB
MHTVIARLCTGCELCVPVCPVDCISLLPVSGSRTGWQAWSDSQAQEARARYAGFLEARGKNGTARDEWERIVTNVERAPAYVAEQQREWYELAKMKVAEK